MSDFPIQPMWDFVYVVKEEAEKSADGLFELPASMKDRAQVGIVLAVGPGYLDTQTAQFIPISVKVGDKVFLKEFGGHQKTYFDEKTQKEWKFFVFSEREIIGKVSE